MKTKSESVLARFAPEEDGAWRGMATLICPVCAKRVHEQDLERYHEANTENSVELCTTCREDFENDNEVQCDSDTPSGDVYAKLLEYVAAGAEKFGEAGRDLNERTAPIVADALGGDAWQSGGGIWLVVKRTSDGRVLTLSPEVVVEYENEEAFEENRPKGSLVMA